MSTRERVDTLENALKELAYAGRRTEMNIDRISQELRLEMAGFKAEMAAYKEENQREARRMNEQWGALANKWGTFTEDVVIPNFPRILERYFGITEEQIAGLQPRARRRQPADPSRSKEFDLVAWTADIVFWNETKASPRMDFLVKFIEDNESIFVFFPELGGKRLVKIASALSMTDEDIAYLTKNRCYAMTLGDETMDLVNFDQVGGLQ